MKDDELNLDDLGLGAPINMEQPEVSSKDQDIDLDNLGLGSPVMPAVEPEEEKTSKMKTLGLAASQGLLFDFADEIGAGIAAPFSDKTYEELRDENREMFKKAEKDRPYLYTAGDVAGGMLPAIITGGTSALASLGKTAVKQGVKQATKQVAKQGLKEYAKKAAKSNIGQGAITGLGVSEAEDLQGLARDAAIGGSVGGAVGYALPKLGKKASELKDTAPVRTVGNMGRAVTNVLGGVPGLGEFASATKFTARGKPVLSPGFEEEVIDDSVKIGNTIYDAVVNQRKAGRELQEEVLGDDSIAFNATENLNNIQQEILELEQKNLIPEDSLPLYRDLKKVLNSAKEVITEEVSPEKTIKGIDKAIGDVGKAQERVIKKVVKKSGEGPDFQKPIVSLKNRTITIPYKEPGSDKIMREVVSIPKDVKIPAQTEDVSRFKSKTTPRTLTNIIEQLDNIIPLAKTPALRKKMFDTRTKLKNTIVEGLGEGSEEAKKFLEGRQLVERTFQIPENILNAVRKGEAGSKGDFVDAEKLLSKYVREMKEGTGSGLTKLQELQYMTEALDELKGTDIRKQIEDVSEYNQLLQSLKGDANIGFIANLLKKGGAVGGSTLGTTYDAASTPARFLIDKTPESIKQAGLASVARKGAKLATKGAVKKLEGDVIEFAEGKAEQASTQSKEDQYQELQKGIETARPEQINLAAIRIGRLPGGRSYVGRLSDIAKIESERERRRMLSGLQQDPAFRHLLEKSLD